MRLSTHWPAQARLALSLLLALLVVLAAAGPAAPVATTPAASSQGAAHLAFLRQGQPFLVPRPIDLPVGRAAAARTLVEALLAGPTAAESAQGVYSAFPAGAALVDLQVDGEEVTVTVALPAGFVAHRLDAATCDAANRQVVGTLEPLGLLRFHLQATDPQEPRRSRPLSGFFPAVPNRPKALPPDDVPGPGRWDSVAGQPPVSGPGRPQGFLSGKTVFVSAGHGWFWDANDGRWETQRPNSYGLVEDLSNAEAVDYFLTRYLWNAGADVWTVRERDMNPNEVIVDNDDGAPGYAETGIWTTSVYTGYNGGTYRYAATAITETATATWTPTIPADGYYGVYAWYRSGANRVPDAVYRVEHAGGVTEVQVNQERDGITWRYLGTYYFPAGTAGSVTLSNQSAYLGQFVIADAVRFGGGMGSIGYGGGTSGRPRYEECCLTWAPYQNAPEDIYPNDVVCRPNYADWEREAGEDAVYFSWHTNAGGGSGTDTFIHDSHPTPGSAELQDFVHSELIDDIRALWDADWIDRGQKTANFGELRELEEMPGMLAEIAFHDNPDDVADLKEADFRRLTARAVYQGIAKYFADRDGLSPHLLPEPPCCVTARNSGPGQATLTWRPPLSGDPWGDPATAYKVYASTDGYAFDNGHLVTTTQATLEGLDPDRLYFFRVTALNAGGESFPCLTAAVRTTPQGQPPTTLLVDGFDRIDALALIYEDTTYLGSVARMYLERMNSYDYALLHGRALAACGVPFDFAANEAIVAGDALLGDYAAADWILGEESTLDHTFGAAEQVLVAGFLDGGGRLFVSGAEIAWDLDYRDHGRDFYHNYLRAQYADDDAGTYQVAAQAGGIFAGLAPFSFDDSTHGAYDVDYPDVVNPYGGATINLVYQGGLGGTAGLEYEGAYRLVNLAFPFETIYPAAAREALMCRVTDFLVPTATPSPTPLHTPTPTSTPTSTPSPTPTSLPAPSPTPSSTPTCTPSPDPSSTPSPTPNTSPTPTASPTPTGTPTPLPSPTPIPGSQGYRLFLPAVWYGD